MDVFAEELAMKNPGSHGGYHLEDASEYNYPEKSTPGEIYVTQGMIDNGLLYPNMNGQLVFKNAVVRFSEVIQEAFSDDGYRSVRVGYVRAASGESQNQSVYPKEVRTKR